MNGRPVRMWTLAGLALGVLVVLAFNGSPVELLRIAQALAVVAFPVLGLLVLSIARDRSIMGEHANKTWVHVIGVLGYLAILGIVFAYLRQIIGTLSA